MGDVWDFDQKSLCQGAIVEVQGLSLLPWPSERKARAHTGESPEAGPRVLEAFRVLLRGAVVLHQQPRRAQGLLSPNSFYGPLPRRRGTCVTFSRRVSSTASSPVSRDLPPGRAGAGRRMGMISRLKHRHHLKIQRRELHVVPGCAKTT